MRVYNLSRRNGLVEYIPKALMFKGFALVKLGKHHAGEEALQKAHELATPQRPGRRAGAGAAPARPDLPLRLQVLRPRAGVLPAGAGARWSRSPSGRRSWSASTRTRRRPSASWATSTSPRSWGPIPINRLRQEYLTSLVNGFVGIPGHRQPEPARRADRADAPGHPPQHQQLSGPDIPGGWTPPAPTSAESPGWAHSIHATLAEARSATGSGRPGANGRRPGRFGRVSPRIRRTVGPAGVGRSPTRPSGEGGGTPGRLAPVLGPPVSWPDKTLPTPI